ncbi:MAG: hypothetical protein QF552_14330 [Litorilituus sp.]|jgi:hypothetical protein|nr:hypothetical protein [Litorilituus sp.]
MSSSVMVIVIVSIVFGILYEMYKKHLEFKTKALAQNEVSAEQKSELTQKIGELTERIQILEKIVTDEGYQVQKEIKHL